MARKNSGIAILPNELGRFLRTGKVDGVRYSRIGTRKSELPGRMRRTIFITGPRKGRK